MISKYSFSRRVGLKRAIFSAAALGLAKPLASQETRDPSGGCLIGEPTAQIAGERILDSGGNVVDAIVAAAMVAAVAAPHQTGIGGYGMSAIVAMEKGTKIFAIDGNSAAPAALTSDFFSRSASEKKANVNPNTGWFAAGVPGILAGLQICLDRFGSRSFSELVAPARELARRGFPWPKSLTPVLARLANLKRDPGSQSLYFPNEQPLQPGATFRNPRLAELLDTLAQRNSVSSFYQGDIAQTIAEAFSKEGGLVTAADLRRYEAKVVLPLSMTWNGFTIHTPPLTAGGLTVLEILSLLKELRWDKATDDFQKLRMQIETHRFAWHERLNNFGDPLVADFDETQYLSHPSIEAKAEQLRRSLSDNQILRFPNQTKTQGGTIHLSAVDKNGNMAALTLTHGESFGAQVTIDELGLTLGHGMSRFDLQSGHPNAPAPGKRPLHNMTPIIICRNGKAVAAIGGRGGRRILNAVSEAALRYVTSDPTLEKAIAAPRFHTEGTESIQHEPSWQKESRGRLAELGYKLQSQNSATLSAVAIESGQNVCAMR